MDAYEITELVNRRMTYRKGWSFRAYPVQSDRADHPMIAKVYWEAQVVNSSPPHIDPRPLVVTSGSFDVIPGPRSAVEDQILRGVQDAENHELREFLRFDGIAPYHPHRADGNDRWARRQVR